MSSHSVEVQPFLQPIANSPIVAELARRLTDDRHVAATGQWGACALVLAAIVQQKLRRPLLLVTAHLDEADDAVDQLHFFRKPKETGEATDVRLYPAFEVLPGESNVSHELASQRLELLVDLASENPNFQDTLFVAPVQALMQPSPSRELLKDLVQSIKPGMTLDRDKLIQWLSDHGYTRLDAVEDAGDFAVRGDIVDVWSPGGGEGGSYPTRISFFGDQVETLHHFDIETLGPTGDVTEARLVALGDRSTWPIDQTRSLLSYLPQDTIVWLVEPAEIQEQAKSYFDRLSDARGIYPPNAVLKNIQNLTWAEIHQFGAEDEKTLRLPCKSVQRFDTKAEEAIKELAELTERANVVVVCDSKSECTRLSDLLDVKHPGIRERIQMPTGILQLGFEWNEQDWGATKDHESPVSSTTSATPPPPRPPRNLPSLQPAPPPPHPGRPADRFLPRPPARRLRRSRPSRHRQIRSDELHHPRRPPIRVSDIEIRRRRHSPRSGHPDPPRAKIRRRRPRPSPSLRPRRRHMVQAKRKSRRSRRKTRRRTPRSPGCTRRDPRHRLPRRHRLAKEFENAFPYPPTEDQVRSADEIKLDLGRARPMDRLLCGDVGYGKTEVAMRAAFKVAEFGKQVAVLVPTTVLAEQHEQTIRQRVAGYPFVVESISRFKTNGQIKKILERTRAGQVDILVGTHRLLSKDVVFADLGLVIIDEEQRFGVEHKEKLKKLRLTVDILTMTATPIPRTLHMSMLGIRDISNLATPPSDRRSVVTEVIPHDKQRIKQALQRELARNGQVYFVHNKVYNIQSVADEIRQMVPDARIVIGHGQMEHEHQLEEVMHKFIRHEADILVSTTIIESGIDIANANTMFINEAENFGLSDLHQLRGRVGRYKHRAYCYLMLSPDKTISSTAAKRLKAMEEYASLGAGFKIALRDLEIRGSGNILGPEQSGHIAAVGYEMYCQLLEEAVKKVKNEPVIKPKEVNVEIGVSGVLPKTYVDSERQRMDLYRRLSRAHNLEMLEALAKDVTDAFGPMPKSVQTLFGLAEIKILAQQWSILSIITKAPDVIFTIEDLSKLGPLMGKGVGGGAGSVRIADEKTVHLRLPATYLESETLINVLRNLLNPNAPKEPVKKPEPPKPSQHPVKPGGIRRRL